MTSIKLSTETVIRCFFTLALGLSFFGAVMVFSSSAFLRRDEFLFFFKQCTWIGLGVVVLWVASRVDYVWVLRCRWLFISLAVVLLALVLWSPLGVERNGARRWLELGPVRLQPSELAKYAIVIFLADFFARRQERLGSLRLGVIPALGVAGMVCGLVFLEPDRSMTFFILLTVLFLWVAAGGKKRHVLPCVLVGAFLLTLLVRNSSTAKRRIDAYIHQDDCSHPAGYQVCQSKVALAQGGVTGVGAGAGQQKLFFLPEPHTDFIFAIVGEEMGFVACAGIIFGFAAFVVLGAYVALRATDLQATLLAAGLAFTIRLQAFLNLSVATGVLPPTGIALPFISYGGSSLVSSMGATGVLINIARSIQ
jgi:cell division protein FtsW